MKLSVVIPNYNGKALLAENLPKIIQEAEGYEVIVVDDASTDDSVGFLKKSFPDVRVLKKSTNKGFSSTVNDGVLAAHSDLVLLLNSDVSPEKGCIKLAMRHFNDQQVGAVGLLQKCHEDGSVILRGRGIGRFHRGFLVHGNGTDQLHVERAQNTVSLQTLWVSGGAGIFRKSVWEILGGLDELYNPFYWEDIDLSYRAMKAGYRLVFEPDAVVIHRQSIGSIRSKYSPQYIKMISYRNQIIFVWLNISAPTLLLNHFLFLPYHLIRSVFTGDIEFINGLLLALSKLPKIISKRMQNMKLWNKPDFNLFIER